MISDYYSSNKLLAKTTPQLMDFVIITVYVCFILEVPTLMMLGLSCFKKVQVELSSFCVLCVICLINLIAIVVHVIECFKTNHSLCWKVESQTMPQTVIDSIPKPVSLLNNETIMNI